MYKASCASFIHDSDALVLCTKLVHKPKHAVSGPNTRGNTEFDSFSCILIHGRATQKMCDVQTASDYILRSIY